MLCRYAFIIRIVNVYGHSPGGGLTSHGGAHAEYAPLSTELIPQQAALGQKRDYGKNQLRMGSIESRRRERGDRYTR